MPGACSHPEGYGPAQDHRLRRGRGGGSKRGPGGTRRGARGSEKRLVLMWWCLVDNLCSVALPVDNCHSVGEDGDAALQLTPHVDLHPQQLTSSQSLTSDIWDVLPHPTVPQCHGHPQQPQCLATHGTPCLLPSSHVTSSSPAVELFLAHAMRIRGSVRRDRRHP